MCDYSSSHLIHLREVTSTGQVIGKGSYGRVIKVYVHGTSCAAKEIHPVLVNGITSAELETTKQSFLTECVNASRIHHPNVVQVLGIHYPIPEAKLPWLVMEMMETSLTGFLEKYEKEKVLFHIKLSILVDISEGLEFLHGQDIIHRDLSSNNVLLTKHCVAKIADLGVAKVVDHSRMKTQTQVPGTLHFMPPETLLRKPCYSKPVDVFSLGCVACHVMSHQWPEPKDIFPEGSLTALTEVQRREDYLQLCTEVALRELVEACLHNTPDGRPEISAVCAELEELKLAKNEQTPLPIGLVELLDAVQEKQLQINELTDTVRMMEAVIQEKDRKIHELLLKEIKHDSVSVDQSQNMTPRVIQYSNTTLEVAHNGLRCANIDIETNTNRKEAEMKKIEKGKIEVDIDANLHSQYGNVGSAQNSKWKEPLEKKREEREYVELDTIVNFDPQYDNIDFTVNDKRKVAAMKKEERGKAEVCVGTYPDLQRTDFTANGKRKTLEMNQERRGQVEVNIDNNFGPHYGNINLAPNLNGNRIKEIAKERTEKGKIKIDPQYGNIDLAASSKMKELEKKREEQKKVAGLSSDPQYGNVDIAIAMQGFQRATVNLDIPHDKKPVATPRANRDSVSPSSSYKPSTFPTPRFKSWYCVSCEFINDAGSRCKGCMNECGRFAGFCSRCSLMVPVLCEEDNADCPVCLLGLETRRI